VLGFKFVDLERKSAVDSDRSSVGTADLPLVYVIRVPRLLLLMCRRHDCCCYGMRNMGALSGWKRKTQKICRWRLNLGCCQAGHCRPRAPHSECFTLGGSPLKTNNVYHLDMLRTTWRFGLPPLKVPGWGFLRYTACPQTTPRVSSTLLRDKRSCALHACRKMSNEGTERRGHQGKLFAFRFSLFIKPTVKEQPRPHPGAEGYLYMPNASPCRYQPIIHSTYSQNMLSDDRISFS
jgi:hypothetical protein